MNFKEYLNSQKIITDHALKSWLDIKVAEASGYDQAFGHMTKIIATQVLSGGKRSRPLLVRLGYQLSGKPIDEAITLASLFPELIHQNLLVHDDIVDRDFLRYGQDNLQVVYAKQGMTKLETQPDREHYGMSMAMLAGNQLRTWAYQAMHQAKFDQESKLASLNYYEEILTATLAGWQIQYQMNFDSLETSSRHRFLKGMELVTSKYSFEAPLMIGLILSDQNLQNSKPIQAYARHLGIAYQIIDDILGLFGDTSKTGKPAGNDFREGKKTLLILDAYQAASGKDQQLLGQIIGTNINSKELNQVKKIVVQTGALDKSVALAKDHANRAVKALEKIDSKQKTPIYHLKQLAEFVVNREY